MRIISGSLKGKTINPDKNFTARPTTDFAKEGLFSILGSRLDFEELRVLDLFSGTGSIGYEFASRGAMLVHSIEKSPVHYSFIQKTIDSLKIEQMKVFKGDVFQFIEKTRSTYNLIFADPPYQLDRIHEIPDLILSKDILEPDGVLILEHGKDNNFTDNPCLVDFRRYGSVHFSFFKKLVAE